MGHEELFEQLKQAIIDQDEDAVLSSVNAALDAGVEPKIIIDQGLLPGLNVIGEQFECEFPSGGGIELAQGTIP